MDGTRINEYVRSHWLASHLLCHSGIWRPIEPLRFDEDPVDENYLKRKAEYDKLVEDCVKILMRKEKEDFIGLVAN